MSKFEWKTQEDIDEYFNLWSQDTSPDDLSGLDFTNVPHNLSDILSEELKRVKKEIENRAYTLDVVRCDTCNKLFFFHVYCSEDLEGTHICVPCSEPLRGEEDSTTLYFDEGPCPAALWGPGLRSADDFFDWGPPERGQGCCGDCKFYSFLRGGCEHERGERDKNADCMNGKFERAKVE